MESTTTPKWWPEIDLATSTPCRHYKHLYTVCGCVHQDFRDLTIHSKDCVYSGHRKMKEDEYQEKHLRQGCIRQENIFVSFDEACELCTTGVKIITRSRNKVRRASSKIRAAFADEDQPPPRHKMPPAPKPQPLSPEELDRRIKKWESEVERQEQLILRQMEDRRKQRRDAYAAFIASERAAEVIEGVAPKDQFFLFNFAGGDGGDLLRPAEIGSQDSPCRFCDKLTRQNNGPPEQMPCGCLLHRDCAADLFLLVRHGLGRQDVSCQCGTRYKLRDLHLDFEDRP